jgi:hypothetical protein
VELDLGASELGAFGSGMKRPQLLCMKWDITWVRPYPISTDVAALTS